MWTAKAGKIGFRWKIRNGKMLKFGRIIGWVPPA
jgi:hypothetical protein